MTTNTNTTPDAASLPAFLTDAPQRRRHQLDAAPAPITGVMHVITLRPITAGVETYSCGGLVVTSRGTDCLRTLLRMMVETGMSGPAKIMDTAGKHRMTIGAIEKAAKLALSEEDKAGLILRPYRDLPAALARAA